MSKYFTLLSEMQDGDKIISMDVHDTAIMKKDGCFVFVEESSGELMDDLGLDGFVVNHNAVSGMRWRSASKKYVRITLDEVNSRLQSGLTVYVSRPFISSDKVPLESVKDLQGDSLRDVLDYYSYYKLV